jgi:hypothetical protein
MLSRAHLKRRKYRYIFMNMRGGWGGGRDVPTLRKFASNWLATALASRVFPVPGGPYSRQPYNISKKIYLNASFT